MKIPYSWLKEYVDFDLTPRELTERLTMVGLEAERVVDLGVAHRALKVGYVISVQRHPRADKLSLCQVDMGSEILSIVCGAPNVAEGQKVPVVFPGQRLPSGRKISRLEIRGIESQGMICSEAELRLGDDASGIMVLPADVEVGAPLSDVLGLDDVVMDFEVTPNRPDCLSIVGVAREVHAITGGTLRLPKPDVRESTVEVGGLASVEILDPEGCPRYSARVFTGVDVGPSPDWLKRKLEAAGLRAINNVVDVTNYVLLEIGHPMHAFDLDRLAGRQIVVRKAESGEQLIMLDGALRDLDPRILVIADRDRSVAIAGVMGGENSHVAAETRNVLLESAYFLPRQIRFSARILGLSTEASMRFERGTDFDATVYALDRAAELILQVGGGSVAKGVLDAYPRKLTEPALRLRPRRVNKLLGTALKGSRMREILSGLGCQVHDEDGDLTVRVPSFRPDLTREIDLVEEVARIHGYNNIENREVVAGPLSVVRDPSDRLKRTTRRMLVALGFTEVVTNSLVSSEASERFGLERPRVLLSNPLSEDASALRLSLLPNLLEVAARNLNFKIENIRIFEIGKIFLQTGDGAVSERLQMGGLMAGYRDQPAWGTRPAEVDFFDVRGVLECYLEQVLDRKFSVRNIQTSIYKPGSSAQILVDGDPIGTFGELWSEILSKLDIKTPAFAFLLDFDLLLKYWRTSRQVRPSPRYPAVERDIALVLRDEVPAEAIVEAIRATDPPLIETAVPFDLYRGDQVPEGHKSLALSLKFRSPERTLREEEVDELCQRILARLARNFRARLRS